MNISLKEDICDLVWPGTQRTEIPSLRVASCISDELQYACRHWAYHFQKIETPLINLDEVFVFLQKHLFHWLEALSLIGRFRESIQVIKILQTVIKVRMAVDFLNHETNRAERTKQAAWKFAARNPRLSSHELDNY
ncbi:hypothetical protein FOC1_g10011820 [Fusarium oxysporum f. sp. cubense race 1]|uniref:Uncharacterized protein n=1 Tax=Fusarium oxysporum f. sp. cubense (strain race 1) TaxID=1229664 RepID=N4UKX5_FUSC1|nr:hypothetical protein FOC1_g10011820 [Fusarium oxysporum f. sp. cubense race 1]